MIKLNKKNNEIKGNDLKSIIVLINNVKKYLEKCINSILKQSYKNIETILVDDVNPDSCPQICDEYKKNDERIVVIHKENGGLSDARNFGTKAARGKYICYIDSDDSVCDNYIEELYNATCKNGVKLSNIKLVPNNPYLKSQIKTNNKLNISLFRRLFFLSIYYRLYSIVYYMESIKN